MTGHFYISYQKPVLAWNGWLLRRARRAAGLKMLWLLVSLLAASMVLADQPPAEEPSPAHLFITQQENDDTRAPSYVAKFLSVATHQLVGGVDLGVSRSAPVAFQGASATRFWIALRRPDTAEWELVGYTNPSGREIRRFPIGRRSLLFGRVPGFWAAESADGRLLHFLLRKQNRWWFTTYALSTGKLLSSIKLRGNSFEFTELPGGRWLVQQSAEDIAASDGVARAYVFDGESGETLFSHKFSSIKADFARLSPSGEHLYLFRRTQIEGRAGKKNRVAHEDHLTKLKVFETRTGLLVYENSVGYNLLSPLSAYDTKGLYVLSQNSLNQGGFTLWRLEGARAQSVRKSDAPCKPQEFTMSTAQDVFTVFCKSSFVHGALSGTSEFDAGAIKLRPGRAQYADNGEAVFLLNDTSSRIGKIDLETHEHIATRSTTSRRTKLVRTAVAVVGVGVTFTTGVGLIPVPVGSTVTMATHYGNSQRLYVLNRTSKELLLFDKPTFEYTRRRFAARNPITFLRFPDEDVPWVFYIEEHQVLAFSPDMEEPQLVLNQGLYLGFDGVRDTLYFATGSELQVYSLRDLSLVAQHSVLRNSIQFLPAN